MSWAEVKADQVIKVHRNAKPLIINGVQHSANVLANWSNEQLSKIGIYPYTEIAEQSDRRFYNQGAITYSFKNNEATGTISAKAIAIDDIKKRYVEQVNTTCYNILCQTDWYVIKHTELGTDIPSKIKTFRASVRTKANELETSINACSSIDDFKTILDRTDPDSAAPIEDWPELEEE
jgi:hypothetical protein|tara:strand:- start:201 stop:734 length:534 start_codon:yes stop_codon:yes gene_type:complete